MNQVKQSAGKISILAFCFQESLDNRKEQHLHTRSGMMTSH